MEMMQFAPGYAASDQWELAFKPVETSPEPHSPLLSYAAWIKNYPALAVRKLDPETLNDLFKVRQQSNGAWKI